MKASTTGISVNTNGHVDDDKYVDDRITHGSFTTRLPSGDGPSQIRLPLRSCLLTCYMRLLFGNNGHATAYLDLQNASKHSNAIF